MIGGEGKWGGRADFFPPITLMLKSMSDKFSRMLMKDFMNYRCL